MSATDDLAIVCMNDHAFAKKKNIELKELAGQNFVQFTEETPTRRATDAVLAEQGVTVNVRTECDNIEVLRKLSRDPLFQHSARSDQVYGLLNLMDQARKALMIISNMVRSFRKSSGMVLGATLRVTTSWKCCNSTA